MHLYRLVLPWMNEAKYANVLQNDVIHCTEAMCMKYQQLDIILISS